MEKSLYDHWYDGTAINLSAFQTALFNAFIRADGNNRDKLINAFPELFKGSVNL